MATYSSTLSGAVQPTGRLQVKVKKSLTGAVTPTGAVTNGRALQMTGALTPAGALTLKLKRNLSGSLQPAGATLKGISRGFAASVTPAGSLFQARGESPCHILVSEFKDRLGKLLDDPRHLYYTADEILHALNVTQRQVAFLTLCVERTVTFTLTNGQAFHNISDQLADFICPLRVVYEGTRLISSSIQQLNARDRTWRTRTGNPARYAQDGLNLLGVTPHPASGSHALTLTYAAEPAELLLDTDAPELPGDLQTVMEDLSFYVLRMKEGGQELANASQYLKRGLDGVQKYAGFVRAKNRAQNYDRQPVDLKRFDRSRFELKLQRQAAIQLKAKMESK